MERLSCINKRNAGGVAQRTGCEIQQMPLVELPTEDGGRSHASKNRGSH